MIGKVKRNELKATEVDLIKQKMNTLISSKNHEIYKNIVMVKVYDSLGWNSYKESEIQNAKKKVKTNHQEILLEEVVEAIKSPMEEKEDENVR